MLTKALNPPPGVRPEAEPGELPGPGEAETVGWEGRSVEMGQVGSGTNSFLPQDSLPAPTQQFQPQVPPTACGSTQPRPERHYQALSSYGVRRS